MSTFDDFMADQLQEAKAEIARLKRDLEERGAQLEGMHADWDAEHDRALAAEQQRDRLREALSEAVAVWDKWLGNGGAPDLQAAGRKLRALLEPKNG